MLVWVLSKLGRSEEEEDSISLLPSKACHFFSACGKDKSRSMPYISSELCSDGFHSSTREESTFTAWPVSGLWYGSLAQQWLANSATVWILASVSSLSSIVLSMALGKMSPYLHTFYGTMLPGAYYPPVGSHQLLFFQLSVPSILPQSCIHQL